jgi:hypothetical protein
MKGTPMTRQQIVTINPYINQIRRTLQQIRPASVDWLVLAHDDAYMLNQLDEAFPESVLAVIALSQHLWPREEERLAEALDWAIRELRVKGVMLVGHSQGGIPADPVRLLGGKARPVPGSKATAGASSSSPLDPLKWAQSQSLSVQNYVEGQMERLSRLAGLEPHPARQQVPLHGLFYRAESGIFNVYDWRQRVFRPLLNEGLAA